MDLLAIAAADPTVIPLWVAFLFAIGMYPVGMFFGCSTCCGRQCNHCTGTLPETLTVAISGIPETTNGPDLATLTFKACYGSGAAGVVTAPAQSSLESDPVDDRGPIAAVSLTDGGSGYAKLGRTVPTVSVTGTSGSGTGATFDVTLAQSQDECGIDRWAVSKITIDGGEGYETGDTLTLAIAEGDTQEVAAVATIGGTTYDEPTLTLSVAGGAGAVLSIDGYSYIPASGYWVITGITVVDGGTGYTNNTAVTVNLGENDEQQPGVLSDIKIRTGIRAPADDWILDPGGVAPTGTGLVLSLELSLESLLRWYEVTFIDIVDGGSGYAVGQRVRPRATEGGNVLRANLTITDVDGNGAVTGLAFFGTTATAITQSKGQYRLDDGIIQSVVISSFAGFRKALTEAVSIANGGVYYREDASLPPYVADVTVGIAQTAPSAGTGAVISATVDDDTESETFGKITGLTIEQGGDGYLAHLLFRSCLSRFNGRSIVVKQDAAFPCRYGYKCASGPCQLEVERVDVELPFYFWMPEGAPIRVSVAVWQANESGQSGDDIYLVKSVGTFVAEEIAPECASIDVTAYGIPLGWPYPEIYLNLPPEATARVTVGGTYEEPETCKRLTREDLESLYVEVSWGSLSSSSLTVSDGCGYGSGWFTSGTSQDMTGDWCDAWKNDPPFEPYEFTPSCGETHYVGVIHSVLESTDYCRFRWRDATLVVGISRAMNPGWWTSGPVTRTCAWAYPVTVLFDEQTLVPTGMELGEPVYSSTFPAVEPPDFFEQYFGSLMDEETVCQNPGKPTVTISAIP